MKSLLKRVLRGAGIEITRVQRDKTNVLAEQYRRDGQVPWSRGYHQARWKHIDETMAAAVLMDAFRTRRPLPVGFGYSLDERCIEYPWLFSQMNDGPGRILDAGSVLNHREIVRLGALSEKLLHIMTLAPEPESAWKNGTSYIYGDLRDTPIRDDFYDMILCVSTLEHVGCDNRRYTQRDRDLEANVDEFVRAMQELHRILKSGGTLYLTVPFGISKNYGSFQQFDATLLDRAIDAFGPTHEVDQQFYRYTIEGWNIANASDCSASDYVNWVSEVWRGAPWPDPRPCEFDHAAAARAVACVRLVKQ